METRNAWGSETVGDRIDDAAALILGGSCHEAEACIRELRLGGRLIADE